MIINSRDSDVGDSLIAYCDKIAPDKTKTNKTIVSGLYYSDCSVHLTSDRGANMDDAYRLWEMSERMAGQ